MSKKEEEKVTKEDICDSVKESMIEIGVAKYMWVSDLKLSEESFDKMLAKATDMAEHIAKGDSKGVRFVLDKVFEDLYELDDEGDEDADSDNGDNKKRIS